MLASGATVLIFCPIRPMTIAVDRIRTVDQASRLVPTDLHFSDVSFSFLHILQRHLLCIKISFGSTKTSGSQNGDYSKKNLKYAFLQTVMLSKFSQNQSWYAPCQKEENATKKENALRVSRKKKGLITFLKKKCWSQAYLISISNWVLYVLNQITSFQIVFLPSKQ